MSFLAQVTVSSLYSPVLFRFLDIVLEARIT